MRCAQAAPPPRPCGWFGWCWCGRHGRCEGCPLAWPQRPVAGALIAQAALGVGSPGGAGGCRSGGVAHQLTPCRAGSAPRATVRIA
jgi:hypothetical protein